MRLRLYIFVPVALVGKIDFSLRYRLSNSLQRIKRFIRKKYLNKLIQFHKSHGGNVSVTCYPLQTQFGVLEIEENGIVSSFIEKPILNKWINIGYFYFGKQIMNHIKEYDTFEQFLNKSINSKTLYSYKHRGIHITVNTIKELEEAERNISGFEKNLRSA